MREAIQLRQDFPALGSERIGLIQNGGDTALFWEWQQYDFRAIEVFKVATITGIRKI
ncbi:MAG: hypothetical protein ACXW1Z_21675 [Methylobacter sp.]